MRGSSVSRVNAFGLLDHIWCLLQPIAMLIRSITELGDQLSPAAVFTRLQPHFLLAVDVAMHWFTFYEAQYFTRNSAKYFYCYRILLLSHGARKSRPPFIGVLEALLISNPILSFLRYYITISCAYKILQYYNISLILYIDESHIGIVLINALASLWPTG